MVCKGHILNTLSDRLYDIFTTTKSTRVIWNALEAKYKIEKIGIEKKIVKKIKFPHIPPSQDIWTHIYPLT